MNIFKSEIESILSEISIGKQPILNDDERRAVDGYAMKPSPAITPLLMYVLEQY